MNIDSGSVSESGGSTASSPPKSSAESLNTLKFGQKIYFKDVGVGVSTKSRVDSFSAETPPKKMRSGGIQGYQPPLCKVEGCKVDLSNAKAYYSRHKVCGMHSKSPKVMVAGIEQRFCQQCSRFHYLPEFDQGKRSCRSRLAGHNERRRKPPSDSWLSSSTFENSGRVGCFLMDFSAYPKPTGRDGWSTSRSSELYVSSQSNPHPGRSTYRSDLFLQSSLGVTHFSDQGIPPEECFPADSDSTRAPSLLSNEPWGTSTRTTAHGSPHLLTTFGYFKGNNSLSEMNPDLGLSHLPQPLTLSSPFNVRFSGNELCQENKRQYVELGQTRAFDALIQSNLPPLL